MKTLNKIAMISFATISIVTIIFAIVQKRIDLGCLGLIMAGISYAAYKDYKNPQI